MPPITHRIVIRILSAVVCSAAAAFTGCGAGVEPNNPLTPSMPVEPAPSAFSLVSAGFGHTCAVALSGSAYCWGENLFGELGDGTRQARTTPTLVTGGLLFSFVSAGGHYTCGVSTAGQVYCWGRNADAELGTGSVGGPDTCPTSGAPVACSTTPSAVSAVIRFASVNAGNGHTCGLTPDGAAYCWGRNVAGQLGDGTRVSRTSPVAVAGTLTFVSLGNGNDHTCGLTAAGAVYCWGQNAYGQLGDGTLVDRSTPVRVSGDIAFSVLGVNALHTCAVAVSRRLYCWGYNFESELGVGTTTGPETCAIAAGGTLTQKPCSTVPVAVDGGISFNSVGSGRSNGHTCGVASSHIVMCWGDNNLGQLGDGTTMRRLVPVPLAEALDLAAVTAGAWHSCGVTSNGVVYCWGSNDFGQLGDGTTTQRLAPVRVAP